MFFLYVSNVSALENFYDIEKIDSLCYNNSIYLEYKNNTPVFYNNIKKQYIIKPPYIYSDKEFYPLIKKLNFKISNNTYNLIISKRDLNTTKDAIIFAPILSKKINISTNIYWEINPLKLNKTKVIGHYIYPEMGEVVARYENGEPAAIKVGNKLYVGFEPNEYSLANLIYIFIVKKTSFSILPIILIILTSLSLILLTFEDIKRKIMEYIYNILSTITFVIWRINVNNKDKVLLNKKRKGIYEYIVDNPGCHLRKISEDLNMALSTITWHLRILEKAELIKCKKVGNKIIYYPEGMDKEDLLLLYLTDTQSQIYEYLLNNKSHLRKIARDLDLNVETVRYNLRKLEDLELVKSKEENNKIVYYSDKIINI